MTKVYDTATDLITFSRLQSQNTTSGSSYLGSDGLLKFAAEDEPRIEYGSDGSLKGLLIEEQRTNLVTYSEDFSQWNTGSTTVEVNTSETLSPSGQNNATKVTWGGSVIYALQSSVKTGSPTITGSIWVKGAIGETVRFAQETTAGTYVGNYSEFTLTGGWQRIDNQITLAGNNDNAGTLIILMVGNTNPASSVYIYGAQLEEGSFATSYIPTSGSQQTRSADIASIPVSAFGYNQDAGTVVVSFDTFQDPGDPGSRFVASVGTDGRFCYVNGDYAKAIDGTNVATGGQLYNPGAFTTATAFGVSGISMALDGGSPGTGSFDGSWGSGNDLMLGHLSNASQLNGHIKSLKYFPRRLTNTQLQELTS